MEQSAFINGIGCAVPEYDVHKKFVNFATSLMGSDRQRKIFVRMAERSQIDHRYSCLAPSVDFSQVDGENFYRRREFPNTAQRMVRYNREALPLAARAIDDLGDKCELGEITHLVVVSCTGFVAPGLDLQLVQHLGLQPGVERTMVSFMGCYAAIPALKLARHIVRSDHYARVLVLALELCTLHLQESDKLEEILSFLLFADGCSAALITGKPQGIEINSFASAIIPGTSDLITWQIGMLGFDMHLSGQVPSAIQRELPRQMPLLIAGTERQNITQWAIHPGGRTVLDAVERGLDLPFDGLSNSREVLREYGNMSSATVLFVLRRMMDEGALGQGCAMAFGPGIAAEAMTFTTH